MEVDLNCDLGEGCPTDATLLPLITSANVACGFHAGDAETAFRTLGLASQSDVQAGAHPSFPDREHFGRREMVRSEHQVFEDCVYQIGALAGLARAAGRPLSHVKAHGALYNMACRIDEYARPIVAAAELFSLPVFGLPGSRLEVQAEGRVPFVGEGFADRRYQQDGTLVPRSEPDAMICDPEEAIRQVIALVQKRRVRTICVHGDNPQAVDFVAVLREMLDRQGLTLRAAT